MKEKWHNWTQNEKLTDLLPQLGICKPNFAKILKWDEPCAMLQFPAAGQVARPLRPRQCILQPFALRAFFPIVIFGGEMHKNILYCLLGIIIII